MRAAVESYRFSALLMSDLRILKIVSKEAAERIASFGGADGSATEKELSRKDGHRRFNKLMEQRGLAFASAASLLSGPDFESCLEQYKKLIAHVEGL